MKELRRYRRLGRICLLGDSAFSPTPEKESSYTQPFPFFPLPRFTLQPALCLSFLHLGVGVGGRELGLPSSVLPYLCGQE